MPDYPRLCYVSFFMLSEIVIFFCFRQRPDTMRTIITFITTEKPGDSNSDIAIANANRLTLMLEEDQLKG